MQTKGNPRFGELCIRGTLYSENTVLGEVPTAFDLSKLKEVFSAFLACPRES